MDMTVQRNLDRGAYTKTPSFSITDPSGKALVIPTDADEDFEYFTADQAEAIGEYYRENGYVVVRGLIPDTHCKAAMDWFDKEIRPTDRFIYRQTTANPERHVYTSHGFVLNPVLNIQSLEARAFPHFRSTCLSIMTHPQVQAVLPQILGEAGKVVQSMYFEGNSATWAHQDTYYLDAEEIGRMAGAWFAMEDIAPGAGRFFIYPKSHRIEMPRNGSDFDIAFNHERYKRLVLDIIQGRKLECRAPALQRGDVLFWSSKTIHGSLTTTQSECSRSSITTHYIPDSSRFLQFQTRVRPLRCQDIGGMRVHKPKDLNRPTNRAVLWVETRFPKPFRATKKLAIKMVTR